MRRIYRSSALALVLVLATATIALADQLQADTDALATASPHANGLDASQNTGTTHSYDYSATVVETGNASNDVFVSLGDVVNASVSVSQDAVPAWPVSLSQSAFQWSAYDQNRAGTLSVTVPAGTAPGTLNHIVVTVAHTSNTRNQTLTPGSVRLNYNITAAASECAPAYTVDFLPPFDDSTPSGLIVNQMKSGRTVPVKATILDLCSGDYVTDGSVTIGVSKSNDATGASTDAVETYADAGASNGNTNAFRWTPDAGYAAKGGGFWIYNLDSKTAYRGGALALNTVYRIDIRLDGALVSGADWALLRAVK